MKPAPFEYHAAGSAEEAIALLVEHGYEAKVLAGGQSLIPTMNFRLAQPAVLIDINGVSELAGIQETGGGIRIGAMTRQRAVERSEIVRAHVEHLEHRRAVGRHERVHPDVHARCRHDRSRHDLVAGAAHDPDRQLDRARAHAW